MGRPIEVAVALLQTLPEALQERAVERLREIVQELEISGGGELGWEDRLALAAARRLEAARRAREAAGPAAPSPGVPAGA